MLDAVYDVVSKGDHGVLMIDAPTGTGKTSCICAVLAAGFREDSSCCANRISDRYLHRRGKQDLVKDPAQAGNSLYGRQAEDLSPGR